MGRKLVPTTDDPRYDVMCLEAWNLRAKGLRLQDICQRLGVTQTNVSRYLRRAAELVREERVESAKTDFEQAVAQSDYVLTLLENRIEESKNPSLDQRQIAEDIKSGAIKQFVFEPYLQNGVVDVVALRRDLEAGKLGPLLRYVVPGRVDLAAIKEYRAASESRRKLLGIDRNKDKIEISGTDGGAIKLSAVAENIAQLAQARKKARTIEVEAREAT